MEYLAIVICVASLILLWYGIKLRRRPPKRAIPEPDYIPAVKKEEVSYTPPVVEIPKDLMMAAVHQASRIKRLNVIRGEQAQRITTKTLERRFPQYSHKQAFIAAKRALEGIL